MIGKTPHDIQIALAIHDRVRLGHEKQVNSYIVAIGLFERISGNLTKANRIISQIEIFKKSQN
jgi:hypothetical protein